VKTLFLIVAFLSCYLAGAVSQRFVIQSLDRQSRQKDQEIQSLKQELLHIKATRMERHLRDEMAPIEELRRELLAPRSHDKPGTVPQSIKPHLICRMK
jgi:hypothetical protein